MEETEIIKEISKTKKARAPLDLTPFPDKR
jgi:hypothetical protein